MPSRASAAGLTDLKRYTHILLDHDGVLVDTEPLYYEATRECIAPLGVHLELEQHLSLTAQGTPAWELARRLGATDHDIDLARRRRNARYRELLATRPIEIEGIEEALARLARRCRLAIVTTALPEDFALIHRHRRIVQHVDFVLTREAYRRSKPHPDPYLAALARFGIPAHKALAVEDSERGLRAAVAARLDCAVVANAFTAGQDFALATYRIDRLAELAEERHPSTTKRSARPGSTLRT